jgi:hypothetical protein
MLTRLEAGGESLMLEQSEMTISEIDEEVTDYDWFAVDKEGRIGHFTTGGIGTLPRSVAASSGDLRYVTEFFRRTPPSLTQAHLAPKAQEAAEKMESEAVVERRFRDFVMMARHGLYSFDHSYAIDRPNPRIRPCPLYYLIAIPARSIHLSGLPDEVQAILVRTTLADVVFSQSEEVYVE